MWRLGYNDFIYTFLSLRARSPNPDARTLERWQMQGIDVHNDIVPIALRRWLPELVPP
jgi:hypothetical protein